MLLTLTAGYKHFSNIEIGAPYLAQCEGGTTYLDMELPVEEALLRANAHIAQYHHLLALVQAERFFEPTGARVEATEWLAWAHFV